MLILVLIPLSVVNQTLLECFVTLGRSWKYAVLAVAKEWLELGPIAAFLLTGHGLCALVLIYVGTGAMTLVAAGAALLAQLPFRLAPLRSLGPYLAFGLPVFFAGYPRWAMEWADRYVIGYYRSMADLGVYAAAYVVRKVGHW